jgi:hypothetical protein
VQDRRADVLAGQRQRLGGLRPDLVVTGLVIQGLGQVGRQPGSEQDRLDELAGVPLLPGSPLAALALEDGLPERRVQRADDAATVLGPGARRHPQQAQPRRVPRFVLGREVGGVVDVGVEHSQ